MGISFTNLNFIYYSVGLASILLINLIPNLYFDDDFDSHFDRVDE